MPGPEDSRLDKIETRVLKVEQKQAQQDLLVASAVAASEAATQAVANQNVTISELQTKVKDLEDEVYGEDEIDLPPPTDPADGFTHFTGHADSVAVFVSASTGSDDNPGTIHEPLENI